MKVEGGGGGMLLRRTGLGMWCMICDGDCDGDDDDDDDLRYP